MPRVSVLLPCFNAAQYLPACVDSLLSQTFTDFEVVAIDDGSQDETGPILAHYAARDPRIRRDRNPRNLGLVATLNRGIDLARGEYLARIDADDEACVERFARQVAFLDDHPEVAVVSSSIVLIDDAGNVRGRRDVRGTHPQSCRFISHFATPLVHSAAMARRELMATYKYSSDPWALHTEDYELWSRLVRAGCRLANLPEPLLRARLLAQGVSRLHERVQARNFLSCVALHLARSLRVEWPLDVLEVVANRIDFSRPRIPLREGLRTLRRLTANALRQAHDLPLARREILDAAGIQRVDILLQCLLRGRIPLRIVAGAELLRGVRSLVRPRVRRHLLSKLGTRLR